MTHRFPFSPIRDLCGGTASAAAVRLGISHHAALKHQERGLSAAQADLFARALGLHPCDLWADWLDHAHEPVTMNGLRTDFGDPDSTDW